MNLSRPIWWAHTSPDFVQFGVATLTCGPHFYYGPHVSDTTASCTRVRRSRLREFARDRFRDPFNPDLRRREPRRRRRRRAPRRRRKAMMPVRTYHHHHHHNNSNNHRLRRIIPRVLLAVFAIYAVSFAAYLLRHQSPHPHPHPAADPERDAVDAAGGGGGGGAVDRVRVEAPSSQKPWPRLPSFLPWTSASVRPPPKHSCEGYFGNGFSRLVDVLPARGGGGGGWFRCHHSETLRSSICEGGRVRLDPGLIAMSRGGEPLDQVMGRAEEEELPKYEPGALQVEAAAKRTGPLVEAGFLDAYVPTGGIGMHTMRSLLDSGRVVPPGELHCSQVHTLFASVTSSSS